MTSYDDCLLGMLLGLAVGDALGAPAEFMSQAAVAEQYGQLDEMVGGGWLAWLPGATTYDTAMSLCLARSLAECGGYDRDDVTARYVAWFRSSPPDIGTTTAAALGGIAAGGLTHITSFSGFCVLGARLLESVRC
jgi:ADP-ribosyl-[dinitrogen reductase] hydrolase